jgi:hypothetical protein
MNRSIERFFETFFDFLSKVTQDLTDFINKNFKRSKPVPAMTGPVQEELPVAPEMVPLAVEPPMIQVECISCGSIGQLTGICQKCQGPICSRSFCRKEMHNEEMDMDVILCRDCAAAIVL